MKSAFGFAAIAVLIALGVFVYRGDLGRMIGGETGAQIQETADKAKEITKEKVAKAASVANEKLKEVNEAALKGVSKAKEKIADVKDAAKKAKQAVQERVAAANDKPATKQAAGNPAAVSDEAEPAQQQAAAVADGDKTTGASQQSGTIESAVDAVKNAMSETEPSAIAWPVVSEEEFERQRQARLAAAAKSSKSASKNNKKEQVPASETNTATSTSGVANGDSEKDAASSSEAAPSGEASASAPAAGKKMTPYERAKSAPEGSLKNPFDYKDPKIVEEGKKVYLKFSCNGCHGGGGGGGMCPPLTNETWVYGGDDDTLYRLITLGTDELGRSRKGQETVVGPMPPYKDIIKDEDQMWKIIVYIRSVWGGRDKKIEW